MLAGAGYNCTAQLLRSIRALHILHRNAQRHQVTRRDPATGDLTYFRVVVVVEIGLVVVLEAGVVVVVEGLVVVVEGGVVKTRFSFTGPMGWATR
jgi:uncharacterized protein YaaW (UPF0174 family)